MIPHSSQFFGPWSMQLDAFAELRALVMNLDWSAHLASPQAAAAQQTGMGPPAAKRNDVAVIEIRGAMMKQASSLGRGTSTVLARRQIRDAVADPNINKIMLLCESPGGTVAGTNELASDVAAAAKSKPTWAYVEDLCCSACYWVASQATKIIANPTAMVGAIGTYGVVTDESGRAEKAGIKVHVVKAGEFKGMGVPGTTITDAQLAELQRTINAMNEFFVNAVATGRKLTKARAQSLADGRIHLAAAALEHKLIDAVGSLDETFAKFSALTSRPAGAASVASGAPRMTPPPPPKPDPIAKFKTLVDERMARGLTRMEAIRAASRADPQLHQQFVAASDDLYRQNHASNNRR